MSPVVRFPPRSWSVYQRRVVRVSSLRQRLQWLSRGKTALVLAVVAIMFLLITPAVYADKMRDGGYGWYRVRAGDTLSELAQRYHTTVRAIRKANNLKSSLIRSGQRLRIPAAGSISNGGSSCGDSVRVRRGDTLRLIASRCHVSVRQIKQWNRLKNNKLRVGQKLKLWAAPHAPMFNQTLQDTVRLPLYQRALPTPVFD